MFSVTPQHWLNSSHAGVKWTSECFYCRKAGRKRGQLPPLIMIMHNTRERTDTHNEQARGGQQACMHKHLSTGRRKHKHRHTHTHKARSSFQLCPLKSSNIMKHLQSNYVRFFFFLPSFNLAPFSPLRAQLWIEGEKKTTRKERKHDDETARRETNKGEGGREADVCWQLVCPPLFGSLRNR